MAPVLADRLADGRLEDSMNRDRKEKPLTAPEPIIVPNPREVPRKPVEDPVEAPETVPETEPDFVPA